VATHPEFIRAVIRVVKEAGGIPSIGESPGIGTLNRTAAHAGIKKMAEEENVPLIELVTPRDIAFPEGKAFKQFTVAAEIFDFDLIINLPKFKTHELFGITGAVKNIFGCVPGILKSQYHFKIQKRDLLLDFIHDLARRIKPGLNIMDAVWAMEGAGGPTAGNPRFMGIVAASSDAFALDEAMLKIINGETVQGFSCPDFKKISVFPEEVFHLPFPFLQKLYSRWLAERPVIEAGKCTGCGTCIEVCAAGAIKKGKRTPKYDYFRCIKCFCCQELCPERAIKVKKNPLVVSLSNMLSRI
jgi:Pyruvate/2-oxoacid:ferredoxin oxidoreductase delta subunit